MITGKELYEAARPFLEKIGFEGTSWEECNFGQGTQAFYLEIAQRLNEQHFMPVHQRVNDLAQLLIETQAENRALTTLVKDYEAMLTRWDPITPSFATTGHAYDNVRLELHKRAKQLIGEE